MAGDDRAPHAPWVLAGEWAIALTTSSASTADALPQGLRPLPGPILVTAARYDDSPVGPFIEFGVAVPARVGLRPGYAVVAAAVSVPLARLGYRVNWGLPAELGTLIWEVDGDSRRVVWEERGLELAVEARGPSLPLLLPVRTVQRRADGPVVIPRRVRGRGRWARATVEVRDDEGRGDVEGFDDVTGKHAGALLSGARFVVRPARRPAGVLSSLRAPLTVPEPATASSLRR